jgi:hypothetical protein
VGDPYRFFVGVFDHIGSKAVDAGVSRSGGLSVADVVYLSFIRTFAALDGRVGTALAQIAFLPYLSDRLGVTVFLSLPTGTMGSANRKGARASPFAVRDPFRVDPSLGDPLFAELSADVQYRALIQACNLLGIRCGSIVPMATLAIDSPLFAGDPQVGFWWDGEPGRALVGAADDGSRDISGVTPARFVEAPSPEQVDVVEHNGQRFFVAHLEGRRITLANAFAAPMPSAEGANVWGDVAMVNYTSRPFPLAVGARDGSDDDPSRPAWTLMPEILAWRYRSLGEEVFLVDANPSVPPGVLEKARAQIEHEAAGGRSNVTLIGEELWDYDLPAPALDAVVGPLVYGVSAHSRNVDVLVQSLRHHLARIEQRGESTPFLAGTANHDTLPATPAVAAMLSLCYAFLPSAVPLIYSGSDVHAQVVTNAQFGSEASEGIGTTPLGPREDELGLFNDVPLNWDDLPKYDELGRPTVDMPSLMARLNRLRFAVHGLGRWEYRFLDQEPWGTLCFGYELRLDGNSRERVLVAMNWDSDPALAPIEDCGEMVALLSVNAGDLPEVMRSGRGSSLPPCSGMVAADRMVAARILDAARRQFGVPRTGRP